jgi:hypothetical protein
MVSTGEIKYPGLTKTSHYCLVVYEVGSSKARGRKPLLKNHLALQVGGLNVGLTTPLRKTLIVMEPIKFGRPRPYMGCRTKE